MRKTTSSVSMAIGRVAWLLLAVIGAVSWRSAMYAEEQVSKAESVGLTVDVRVMANGERVVHVAYHERLRQEVVDEIAALGAIRHLNLVGARGMQEPLNWGEGGIVCEALEASGSDLTDDGIVGMVDGKSIKRVWLRETAIGDGAVAWLAGTGVEELDLRGTLAGAAGIRALAGATRLSRLCVDGRGLDDRGLKDMGGFVGLKSVVIGRSLITDVGLRSLAWLKSLKSIDIADCDVTGMCFRVDGGGGFASVCAVGLLGCPYTDDGLEAVMGLEGVWKVVLAGSGRSRGAWLSGVSKPEKLRELELPWCNEYDREHLVAIGRFGSLERLSLMGCDVDDGVLGEVGKCGRLRSLDVGATRVTWSGLEQLRGLGLEHLSVDLMIEEGAERRLLELFPGLKPLRR